MKLSRTIESLEPVLEAMLTGGLAGLWLMTTAVCVCAGALLGEWEPLVYSVTSYPMILVALMCACILLDDDSMPNDVAWTKRLLLGWALGAIQTAPVLFLTGAFRLWNEFGAGICLLVLAFCGLILGTGEFALARAVRRRLVKMSEIS